MSLPPISAASTQKPEKAKATPIRYGPSAASLLPTEPWESMQNTGGCSASVCGDSVHGVHLVNKFNCVRLNTWDKQKWSFRAFFNKGPPLLPYGHADLQMTAMHLPKAWEERGNGFWERTKTRQKRKKMAIARRSKTMCCPDLAWPLVVCWVK